MAKTPPWLALHVVRYATIASMTRCGTCVPAGPSKKIGVRPSRVLVEGGELVGGAW